MGSLFTELHWLAAGTVFSYAPAAASNTVFAKAKRYAEEPARMKFVFQERTLSGMAVPLSQPSGPVDVHTPLN